MQNISPIFDIDLKFGMNNSDVKRLQELLATDKELYPEGLVTGFYGEKTMGAVRRFQLKYKVIENINDSGAGRVGPLTRKKIAEIFDLNIQNTKKPELHANNFDDQSNSNPEGVQIMSLLRSHQPNPATSNVTKLIRKFIKYEFKFENEPNFDKTQLQCTEYVHFRVKQKLGIEIQWPVKTGRNGKDWWKIFQNHGLYKILENPEINCAVCFTDGFTNPRAKETGHVAFIEEIGPDNSIKISDANWDEKGSYREQPLKQVEWKNIWKVKFINFS